MKKYMDKLLLFFFKDVKLHLQECADSLNKFTTKIDGLTSGTSYSIYAYYMVAPQLLLYHRRSETKIIDIHTNKSKKKI